MTGGTLIVTRAVNLHKYYKSKIEVLGFNNVTTTDVDKDGLNSIIFDLKPKLILMDAIFYQSATPYMMSLLLQKFPKLNIAVISMSEFPADLAMKFISNGVHSYVSFWDGLEQFNKGLVCIRDGKIFISASVQERISLRSELLPKAKKITDRQEEVARLISNGFSVIEAANTLHCSWRTIEAHKREIYNILCVRNENELIRTALKINLIDKDEMIFYGSNFELNPQVEKRLSGGKNDNKNNRFENRKRRN